MMIIVVRNKSDANGTLCCTSGKMITLTFTALKDGTTIYYLHIDFMYRTFHGTASIIEILSHCFVSRVDNRLIIKSTVQFCEKCCTLNKDIEWNTVRVHAEYMDSTLFPVCV